MQSSLQHFDYQLQVVEYLVSDLQHTVNLRMH